MRKHFRTCREHLLEQFGLRAEVGDQHLDPGARIQLMDLADRFRVQPSTFVVEVVACDTGDRRVLQPHLLNGFGNLARFIHVEGIGLAGVDVAEVASACARGATDEEGGLAVLPAFEDVGACGFLTDRVESEGLHTLLDFEELGTSPEFGLDPLGFAFDGSLRITGFNP